MKLSKTFIACAIAFVASHSQAVEFKVADATFTPYARLVGGIDYINHGYKAGVSGSRIEVASNQWGTSYFGMGLSVPVMPHLSAIGQLESGFGTGTGATNDENVLFNRQANVGVKHDQFGQLTAGTHLIIAQDIGDMDPMGFQSIGLNTLVNGANDGAAQNSVLYRSAEYYGLSVGYMHEFGGEVGAPKRSSGDGASLAYQYQGAKIRAIYQTRADNYGRYSGGAFYGLGSQGQWTYVKNLVLAASYDFGRAKVFAGYDRVEAPDSGYGLSYTFDDKATMNWVGINYRLTDKLTALGGAYQVKLPYSDKKSTLYAAGVNYAANQYFTVYSTIGYVKNNQIASGLVSSVGNNNHALSYDEVSCQNASDCNGASQLGGYTGVVFKI